MRKKGPWETKSGGTLEVAFCIPWDKLKNVLFNYDSDELHKLPTDIRGLRVYRVQDLALGRIGGNEFHRIRTEIVFCTKGSVLWSCEDLNGGKKEFTLRSGAGILLPSLIMHTYKVLDEGSELEVVANTIFIPEDPQTHDTYSANIFYELAGR